MSEQLLTPRQIVHELDRYIIGQNEAKKAVAIALRNRYRRSKVEEVLRDEIIPKNILMVGPTGVGKTEIARRLAKLVRSRICGPRCGKHDSRSDRECYSHGSQGTRGKSIAPGQSSG